MNRRSFIKGAAAAGAAIGFPSIIPSTVLGKNGNVAPSNKAAIGIIACGNRSREGLQYKNFSNSEVLAVCDPIKWKREHHQKAVGGGCKAYVDFREILERDDIDAVHIATADHWHLPIAMLAAKAGKDCYIEKPLGICIDHDIKARKLEEKYGRVIQYGAQQRAMQHVRMGIELVLNGHIGDVKEVYVWAPQGASGGKLDPKPVPPGIDDYDLWLGPAPKAPFCEDRVLYKKGAWHTNANGIYHIYDYAIGFIAGWGAHPMDMLQWWVDNSDMKDKIPIKYEGKGTIPTEGLLNTVTHWNIDGVYANGIKFKFMDTDTAMKLKPHPGVKNYHGTLFVGSEGWVMVNRDVLKTSTPELRQKARNPGEIKLKRAASLTQDFANCILSRETPVDDLQSAVLSDIATHLSEIAVRTGKVVEWDAKKERIKDNKLRKYMYRELRKPWKI